jgi:hypothetical protein
MIGLRPSLIVCLLDIPRAILANVDGNEISLFGEVYKRIDTEVCFYDFLRNKASEVVGIRVSPLSHEEILADSAHTKNVVVNVERCYVELYFHASVSVDDLHGADQGFGDDAFWRNQRGDWAVQVGTAALSEEEFGALSRGLVHPLS